MSHKLNVNSDFFSHCTHAKTLLFLRPNFILPIYLFIAPVKV